MNTINQNDFEEDTLEIELPEKLHFLLTEPARYKVLYGGRGGAKTETIARALIIFSTLKKLRIACFREFQNSMDESVYATIKNCISDLHLEDEFDVQKTTIISKRTGSEFIFAGLRYKIDAIKSMARIDIAWVEEARNASKVSLDKLFPTIRGQHKDNPNGRGGPFGKGPEIWLSFNPELDSDEVYKRFVKQRHKYAPEFIKNEDTGEMERYAIVCKIDWRDNKFFPEDLRQQMQVAKEADEDEYLHVWEGHTKQVLAGAVYAKEIKKVISDGRRGHVPYNPNKPVHTFWDLGHRDKTAIWFIQHAGLEFNVINYYENSLQKMPFYIKHLQDQKYNYGVHYLPHDGDNETLSNVTPKKQLQDIGYKVRLVQRPARKMVGINAARTIFDLCNFDEDSTSDGWQCLCNYGYKVNELNGVLSKEPEHDTPWSHGADGFQTFALSLKNETEIKRKEKTVTSSSKLNLRGSNSWMG